MRKELSGRDGGVVLRAALAVLIMVLVAGCGPGDATSESPTETIGIDHQYGHTDVGAHPERVISLTGAWTDALVALDVPIVAEVVSNRYSGEQGRFPWTVDHESELIEQAEGAGLDYERLAALAPDVIFAGYVASEEEYQRLAAIAPTVPVMDSGAVLDPWDEITLAAGRIFGAEERAEGLVADVRGQIEQLRQDLPATQGKTFAYGQFTGDQFGLVAADSDPAALMLGEFGLALDPASKAAGDGAGRVLVSLERVDVLDADLVIMWPVGQDPAVLSKVSGWKELSAVRAGAVVLVDDTTANALAAPSIASVPWALEHQLRPAFERLAD